MAQAFDRRPITVEALVRSQDSHAIFDVDKVTLGQVFRPSASLPPVSTVPPMLHTHLHHNTTLIRRTSGRSLKQ
jgi:hypothetical protein